jgi:hypothetical protein
LLLLLQTKQLASLLQQCCSSGRADLQLNVVSALGQLARDQQLTAEAIMEPQGKASAAAAAAAAVTQVQCHSIASTHGMHLQPAAAPEFSYAATWFARLLTPELHA